MNNITTAAFWQPCGQCDQALKRVGQIFMVQTLNLILSTATIANTGEMASKMIEEEVELIADNGAPCG
jgi:ATP-dependent helicase YprA (DUF1998 family)